MASVKIKCKEARVLTRECNVLIAAEAEGRNGGRGCSDLGVISAY